VLFWRDDGSTDGTPDMLRRFATGPGPGSSVEVNGCGRIGPTQSFLRVLREAAGRGFDTFAFADQDDVWLPDKLTRGMRALGVAPFETPALYFARQVFVDEALARIGISCRLKHAPGFPAALTQNVATGCTMMMNRPAAALIALSRHSRYYPPRSTRD
jgi:glycosyltransferase involved in cell wall biosynthesis